MLKLKQAVQAVEIKNTHGRDELIAQLWEMGTVGLIENSDGLEAFFPDEVDLIELTRAYGCLITRPGAEGAVDPSGSPLQHSDPVMAGSRFFIVPSSSPLAPPSGWMRVDIDARNAFGSGSHESTQLAVEALERHLRPGSTMLDVGSGSGVLSAIAQHLSAGAFFACDTHLESTVLTRRHAPHTNVFAGSVDSVASASIDLVVANISTRVLDDLSGELGRITKPDGWLILSGFIADKTPQNFLPTFETGMNEWRCWVCRPPERSQYISRYDAEPLQPFAIEWW